MPYHSRTAFAACCQDWTCMCTGHPFVPDRYRAQPVCGSRGLSGAQSGNSFNGALFFNHTATTEIYTLSLHDALPISSWMEPLDNPIGIAALSPLREAALGGFALDRKSTRLNSSHTLISYAVFCL